MSRIDHLIRELCPEGVPFRQLGSVAEVQRGRSISRTEVTEGPVPVLAGGRQPSCWHIEGNRDGENVVIAGSGAYAGFVSYWMGPIWVSDSFSIAGKPNLLLTKFCFYLLKNRQTDLHQMKRGSGVPHVYAKDVALLPLPVPPLEVQREIVSILDKFTQLEAELEAELEARNLQFLECSERMLAAVSLSSDLVAFGEVATIKRGASPRPISKFISSEETAIPWIKIGDVAAGTKFVVDTKEKVSEEGAAQSRLVKPGDFLLSNSMSFGRPYISKITGCIHDGWLSISDFEDRIDPDFLFHLLKSKQVQSEFQRKAGSGTVKNLNAEIVKSVSLPLPDLFTQRRIAEALDAFEEFTADLTSGLPAEIAARRKQYEYYRNKLLTFRELEAA